MGSMWRNFPCIAVEIAPDTFKFTIQVGNWNLRCTLVLCCIARRTDCCTSAHHLTTCQRITAEPVAAVFTTHDFARREQSCQNAPTLIIDAHSAHHMMHGWVDLHRLFA